MLICSVINTNSDQASSSWHTTWCPTLTEAQNKHNMETTAAEREPSLPLVVENEKS